MKSLAASAVAILLASTLVSCSRSSHHPASSIEAAAAAREHALQQARAAASALEKDRQQLESIPPPSKNVYLAIHTRQSWTNPFLIVSKTTVNLTILYPDDGPGAGTPGSDILRPVAARRRELDLRLPDLAEALAATPQGVWPYGRVIAVEEDPLEQKTDRAQIRRNVEATMQILSDLGIVAYEWPVNTPR
ncbi:MAG: hypothetical protein ACLGXA_08530 [Acidobacteriota bacterium]